MDRLGWAIQLIKEAQREKRYLAAMKADLDKLSIYDPYYFLKHARIARKYRQIPDKKLIKDNLEMARRILRDEYI